LIDDFFVGSFTILCRRIVDVFLLSLLFHHTWLTGHFGGLGKRKGSGHGHKYQHWQWHTPSSLSVDLEI
jgi:hypothetical protein